MTAQQVDDADRPSSRASSKPDGGTVAKIEYWGVKSLAYRIKKNRKAHFTLLNIDAPAAAVAEMERQMGINEDILRFLTVRVDELEEGPSAMMQKRDRDDRGDRGDRWRPLAAVGAPRSRRPRRGDRPTRAASRRPSGGRRVMSDVSQLPTRRPFFRRRKTCPFSGANAPKIDYKDVRLLQRYISERGKIVPSPHHRGLGQEAARAGPGHQARALPRPAALRDPLTQAAGLPDRRARRSRRRPITTGSAFRLARIGVAGMGRRPVVGAAARL